MKEEIHQLDALTLLKQQPDESTDLICTDIAYESLEKHRKIGTTTRLKKEWFPIFKNSEVEDLLKEFYRVLKKNRHFYFFCDNDTMFYVKPLAERIGFHYSNTIIWNKMVIGMGYHYRKSYENILFFEKGKRPLNNRSIGDVVSFKRVHGGYPTEKPLPLLELLIQQSTQEGEVVVDPFMGSGTTAVAALLNRRGYIVGDIDEKAIISTKERIKGSIPQTIEESVASSNKE